MTRKIKEIDFPTIRARIHLFMPLLRNVMLPVMEVSFPSIVTAVKTMQFWNVLMEIYASMEMRIRVFLHGIILHYYNYRKSFHLITFQYSV